MLASVMAIPHVQPHHFLEVAASIGWDKLIIALAVLAGITLLAMQGKVSSEAAVGVYTTIVGYVLGSAVGKAQQQVAGAQDTAAAVATATGAPPPPEPHN